jgi:drug/metabolite transporter (DMT)-like permease
VTPTHLTWTVTALVLWAGVLHAVWNAMAKQVTDKLVAFGLIGVGYCVAASIALPLTGMPRSAAIAYAVVSAVLHLGYSLALMQSYRLGDFGHTYPLARGTSPLLVTVGAWVLAHEHLAAIQLVGVVTVAGGLMAIVFAGGRLSRADLPATRAAVLTGVAIACYTLVDGLGVRRAHNPFGYTAFLFVLEGPLLLIVALAARRRDPAWRSPATIGTGVGAGLISLLAYGIVIWAQTRGPLALVSALRETSVITAAVIGAVLFHERFGWRRVPSAIAVVTGIILINL